MIYIYQRVINVIQAELSVCKGIETGGVFLGYEAPDKNVFIVDSTFSGPGAIHAHQYFETDEQYVNYQINMLSRLYRRQLSVVGFAGVFLYLSAAALQALTVPIRKRVQNVVLLQNAGDGLVSFPFQRH